MEAKELKEFRESLDLTQEIFGQQLGFKKAQIQISQLESGRRPISTRLEKAIAQWRENIKLTKTLKRLA